MDSKLSINDDLDESDRNDDNEENDEQSDNESDDELSQNGDHINVRDFFEDEAELSGSDASSDEDDNDDNDGYDDTNDQQEEDLPSESELRDQIGRIHHKQLLDDDKRELLLMQEKYLENGDLHDNGKTRTKMFKWNNMETFELWQNVYQDSDSGSDDNDDEIKQPKLKMDDNITVTQSSAYIKSIIDRKTGIKETVTQSSASFKSSDSISGFNCQFSVKRVNSLANFVVRDERLKTIISKRPLNCKNQSIKMNKKFRNNKTNHTSIFDVIDSAQ